MDGPSLWWFGLAFLLALFMVVAMMEFTVSLLARRPSRRAVRIDAGELERRLLTHVFETMPVRITRAAGGGLQIRDYVLGDDWRADFQRAMFSDTYRARMVLDTRRHELRWYESVTTRTLFLGFDGWIPRFRGHIAYSGGQVDLVGTVRAYAFNPGMPRRIGPDLTFGMNTVQLKREVSALLHDAGWSFKPVTLPFFATGRWLTFSERVLPAWIKQVSAGWFWGTVYVGSYVAVVCYLMVGARLIDPDAWSSHNILIALLVSVGWWAIWGLLTWVLYGLPGLRQPVRRRSRRTR